MKIDLQEIAKRAAHIKQHVENENAIKDPDSRYSYKLPLIACEQVANALEQLPKLVEALQRVIEIAAPVNESEVEALDFGKQTLEPFTNKTESNG